MSEQEQQAEQETEQQSEQETGNDEVETLRAELERYKAKHAEQEKHVKEAKRRADQVQRERQDAERKKAEEEGNHQKLWETEKDRADRLEMELAERDKAIQERDLKAQESSRDSHTAEIAASLTSDTKRLKPLKKLIKEHVVIEGGETRYEVDGVTIDKNRFTKYLRDEYPSLVDGSGMTGGGATGVTGSGAANSANSKAQAAKGKGDLTAFLQAQLNQ